MKRKIFLMALAVLLVLSVLAACGQTSGGSQGSGSNQGSGGNVGPGGDQGTGNSQGSGSAQSVSAQSGESTQDGQRFITAQQAQQIALDHAGKTAEQVNYLELDSELYERIPHYDVEFTFEGQEYEYEIDAVTGEILKAEKDR